MTTTTAATRQPVLYLSHGAPPLADDRTWTGQLAAWSADLPRPQSILMVSAHWEEAPLALSATTPVPLVYDFWGFPQRYYDVTYDAPGAPQLAADVAALVRRPGRPGRCTRTSSAAWTTARTCRWWRCSPRTTSPSCRCPCRPSTRSGCST